MSNINLIYYLIAGIIFGALALKTGIPAAPLAGALIGSSILSISGKVDYRAFNSAFSCQMLELVWSNKILNFYRHILNKRYF